MKWKHFFFRKTKKMIKKVFIFLRTQYDKECWNLTKIKRVKHPLFIVQPP